MVRRFASVVAHAATVWLWLVLSASTFLLVTAISSATDLRMLDLRRNTLQVLVRDLLHGMRAYFGILRDRRTPYLARIVLALALLYWLLPLDLAADDMALPGVIDDLIVAILAGKIFTHLCPEAVVAAHAASVRARAERHAAA